MIIEIVDLPIEKWWLSIVLYVYQGVTILMVNYDWLVVWNMAFIFHNILGIMIPTDFYIFQRG